jgi:hypothetical protein
MILSTLTSIAAAFSCISRFRLTQIPHFAAPDFGVWVSWVGFATARWSGVVGGLGAWICGLASSRWLFPPHGFLV